MPFPSGSGIIYLPSFQHAFHYALFIQQEKPEQAEALLKDESSEWDATQVAHWCKTNGLEPLSADLVVFARQMFEDLMLFQLDDRNGSDNEDFLNALKYQVSHSMTDPKTDKILVCSGAEDNVFSCGFSYTEVKKMLKNDEERPIIASHVWATIVRHVLNVRLRIKPAKYNISPHLSFMKGPVRFSVSHKKTVLLGSNSIFRYLKSIQQGEFVVIKSATFEDIVNSILAKYNPQDYHYLVFQAGVIEADRGKDAEVRTMEKLRAFLDDLVKEPNCPQVLICPTFPYADAHSRTRGYDRWLAKPENLGSKAIMDSGKVQIATWEDGNPFFPDGKRAEDLFDGDSTHISKEGTQHLWKFLTGYLPDMGLVSYDLHDYPYGDPSYRNIRRPRAGGRGKRPETPRSPRKRPSHPPEPEVAGKFRLKE